MDQTGLGGAEERRDELLTMSPEQVAGECLLNKETNAIRTQQQSHYLGTITTRRQAGRFALGGWMEQNDHG